MPSAPFFLFHSEPFLGNGLECVVGTGSMCGPVDAPMAHGIFAFKQ